MSKLERFSVDLTHPTVGTFTITGSVLTADDGRRFRSPGLQIDPVPRGPFPEDFEAWIDSQLSAALSTPS